MYMLTIKSQYPTLDFLILIAGSKVLLISSEFGLVSSASNSIYCAAKAGIDNFADSKRRELLCNSNIYCILQLF